ncbi:MAG: aspartate/glutamate racemase family protein [Desulfovibrio sp.]|jgi:Asp/Glu/hydantoin racemase|nr:aspartate/glutamate racemase family protein [Desulfovibrio sp.]
MRSNTYGFYAPGSDDVMVSMQKGQNIAGYSVGIVYLDDIWYPLIPGNVVNAWTYDFPVRLKAVPHLDNQRLFRADPTIADDLVAVSKHLVEKEGCRAICAACGFFGNFQKHVAEAVDVPVALSSLMQIPWIKATLKKNQKIGVLSANAASVTPSLLDNCGIDDPDCLVLKDTLQTAHFSAVVTMTGSFDNNIARKEVVQCAQELVLENPDIGAIVLECSDMPPYAASVQRAVGLPVFDFITLIRWLHNATTQRPYEGFI